MTVKDFIDNGSAVKGLVYKKYVPYEEKIACIKSIISSAFYDENKEFHRKSNIINLLYKLNLIDEYTNIQIDFHNALFEYNALAENGVMSAIIMEIPEYELAEFESLFAALSEDEMMNFYDNHAYISRQVERFGNLVGMSLKPVFESLQNSVDELDDDKIKKLGKVLNNAIKKAKSFGITTERKKRTTTAVTDEVIDAEEI